MSFVHSISTNTLNLTLSNIISSNVTIYIEGLTNPVVTSSSTWSLSALTSTDASIAVGASSNLFTAVCGSNCKECLNTSSCLSCYSNPLVNSLSLLDNSTKTCINACNSSQFLQGGICYSCNTACLTCDLYSSNCTSCSPTYQFY